MSTESRTSLQRRLRDDINNALRAGDKDTVTTLRMARAAIQRRELDTRTSLDDTGVEKVLQSVIKQRRESAVQYGQAGREDLAARESAEIDVLQAYLPEPLSEADATELMDRVIQDLAAASLKDMGRVMAEIKQRGGARVDMGRVSGLVRSRLQRA